MNSLKKDFDIEKRKHIPCQIVCKKDELQKRIVEKSKLWHDREQVLRSIFTMSHSELKDLCNERKIGYMKKNPRFTSL